MQKFLPIVNIGLSFIALVISVITLVSVSGLKANISQENMNNKASVEAGEIPLSRIREYNLEKQFIFTYDSEEDSYKNVSVVLNVSFGLDKEKKDTEEIIKVLPEKENILRDQIQKILREKDPKLFESESGQLELQNEIISMLNKLFETNSFVAVYFDPLISKK